MSDETLVTPLERKPVLDYPCGEVAMPGAAREVAPGVLWMRMPMPLSLMSHVNLWAVRDRDGWAVIDTGLQTSDTVDAWRRLFTGGALAQGGLTRLFVTHMHPDHSGLAGWLTRKFSCRLWMARTEYLMYRLVASDAGREAPGDVVSFYRRAGWDDDAIDAYRAHFGGFGKYVYAPPDSYQRVHDGDELLIGDHIWRVVVGTGHSPEHACFYSPELKLLISGDQVLPRVSPNVSVIPTEPDADPTGDWLDSLDKLLLEIPDDVLVLPGHDEPFLGLHLRLEYLRRSQHLALDRIRDALRQPRRAIDVFAQLFSRSIGSEPSLRDVATGESMAHLNYLLHRDEIEMTVDNNGVAWYRMK
ncbi:MBL fold metallo-hydrolase [Burkholderia ubonensis]|uniref:MBL fold metallo-hydrolase n=1 Tax=Burkholderia ubonensis TaxID=101571 RepID=A0AAW3N4W5_9BURK|nr:MBL fold metallo-hydrolase [Burkholderia ubonensis]KVT41297.1 MBL fold metallo-hydrolase [Burkholderia ubonensis]